MLQVKSRYFHRSRVFFIGFSALLCVSLTACSDSNDGLAGESQVPSFDPNDVIPPPSVDSVAVWLLEDPSYSIFLRLIEEADLVGALTEDNDGNQWTVFAPADSAFANSNIDLDSLTDTERLALPKLHVFSGLLESTDLVAGELSMVEGSVTIDINSDGKLTVGGSSIVARDRRVANGIIHVINPVITQTP